MRLIFQAFPGYETKNIIHTKFTDIRTTYQVKGLSSDPLLSLPRKIAEYCGVLRSIAAAIVVKLRSITAVDIDSTNALSDQMVAVCIF